MRSFIVRRKQRTCRNNFYQHCPRLSETSSENMDADITLPELLAALGTCEDSAPESDWILYGVYKKLWGTVGSYIVDAWNYSCQGGYGPLTSGINYCILTKGGKGPW